MFVHKHPFFTIQSIIFSKNISKYEVVLAGTCPQVMTEETGNMEDNELDSPAGSLTEP